MTIARRFESVIFFPIARDHNLSSGSIMNVIGYASLQALEWRPQHQRPG